MVLPPLPETIDHFRVVSQLGAGGMGVVYRAEDLLLHRPVALKVMRAEHVADPRRRERFVREARMAASLVHPNVATVYEVGEVGGTIFIAMELVPGETLRAVLSDAERARDRVAVRRALRWSVGIARALARAHELGIVHRDLKPDNVMVLPDDEVKLLDFGIAKGLASESEEGALPATANAESMTAEGVVLGTPAYMSPEQARGERLDVRSDVFSFGAMLFEMLSGVSPFLRATPLDTLAAILRDAPPRLDELAASVPGDLRAIVARCLAKAPKDRFANGGELLAALQGVTVEEGAVLPAAPPKASSAPRPVSSQHTTRTEAIGPAETRGEGRPAAPWVAAVGAVIVAAAFVSVALRSREKTHAPADAAAVVAAGCTSNSACSREHDGGAWKCNSKRHECVEIGSAECSVFANDSDLQAEDTVWLGELLPTTGPDAEPISGERLAIELARRDFAEALGGSSTREGNLHARPIAVVLCDENQDAKRASLHLAEDVEVPAVIGFRYSKTALDTIPSVLLPRHVLSFISVSQRAGVTSIPQTKGEPRLIWRSTLDLADAGRALAALVGDLLEPRLRAAGLRGRAMRVAFVRSTTGGRDASDAFFRHLHFNGKAALDNGEAFRQYVFEEGAASSVVSAVLDFSPDVIAVQGGTFTRDVLVPLERAWRRPTHPIYVTATNFADDTASFVGEDPGRRARFLGLANVSTTMTNAELVLHYNFAFPHERPIARTYAPQPSYDAFYVLAYAAEAIGDGETTGPTLSRAILRLLPPGDPVDVGPARIHDAFQMLRTGGQVDLVGAIGSLDFDLATGEAPIDYSVLCLGVDDRGAAKGSVESGLIYNSHETHFSGTLRCP